MVLYTIVLIVHILICIALVLVILSQTSKGGLDANLGGAAMNVFGGSGASAFLKKATQTLALLFVVSCVSLAFLVRNLGATQGSDIVSRQKKLAEQKAPGKAPAKAPATAPVKAPAPAAGK
ncbi:MAG TPA: preprotein translocase subunit SecG [Candidatus Cloacimonadota bacterium]|nr:preprotein translocase subunit SecG [Candidatus Cloacimonadota bacterium]